MPEQSNGTPNGDIRVPWSRSERPVPRRLLRPLQSFLETEVASGILLLAAIAVAQVWANLGHGYQAFWTTELTMRLGRWVVAEDLRSWVNDGLMALFFMVVGLEIKRELLTGELRDRRVAVLPVVAALGGMIVPALIYLAFTAGTPSASGWGMVMPTDIALALGVLALAMPRAPAGLRIFLLALAIVDDLGSIVVVALFYSGTLAWGWLGAGAGIVVGVLLLERIHVRAAAVYIVLGVAMWFAFLASGLSPTLAGVTMGFLTPAVAFQRPRAVSEEAHRVADLTVDDPFPPDADAEHWLYLAELSREAVSPLARVETALHPWTSYLVVPLFALANAGIALSAATLGEAARSPVALGIVVARVLGKTVGISLACFLAVRLGIARLPSGTSRRHLLGAAAAAGVPFTVSLFIAEIALPVGQLQAAKVGIVVAGALSSLLGFLVLRSGSRAP
jgi:NhaA family Na+:H+ antiporter